MTSVLNSLDTSYLCDPPCFFPFGSGDDKSKSSLEDMYCLTGLTGLSPWSPCGLFTDKSLDKSKFPNLCNPCCLPWLGTPDDTSTFSQLPWLGGFGGNNPCDPCGPCSYPFSSSPYEWLCCLGPSSSKSQPKPDVNHIEMKRRRDVLKRLFDPAEMNSFWGRNIVNEKWIDTVPEQTINDLYDNVLPKLAEDPTYEFTPLITLELMRKRAVKNDTPDIFTKEGRELFTIFNSPFSTVGGNRVPVDMNDKLENDENIARYLTKDTIMSDTKQPKDLKLFLGEKRLGAENDAFRVRELLYLIRTLV